MAEQDKSRRKKWTREETLLFLKCYSSRKCEFEHSRKKKFAYANVLEDMIFQGFNDPAVTTTTLEAKMRTLLSAYKSAKDNARQTGASPCIAPYITEMDEIFGDKPIISNVHTLHLGTGPIQPLRESNHIRSGCIDENICEAPATSSTPPSTIPTPSTSPPIVPTPLSSPQIVPNSSSSCRTSSTSTRNQRTRKTAKERYYEAKLAQKQAYLDDVKEMLKEKWKAQEQIEKQKMELLARLLNNQ